EAPDTSERRVSGEKLDILRDATVVAERLPGRRLLAVVRDLEGEALDQESGLTCPGDQFLRLEGRALGENLRVGPVAHAGTGDLLGDRAGQAQLAAVLEGGERGIRAWLALVAEDTGLPALE